MKGRTRQGLMSDFTGEPDSAYQHQTGEKYAEKEYGRNMKNESA